MNSFFWAPMGAAGLHMIEEFVYPGGFAAWDRRYRPAISTSITPRFHIVINGLLLLLCYNVGAMGGTSIGIATWLTVTALLFSNAIWHVVGAVKTRSYSPGMITGLLLYVPLTVYGYVRLLQSGQSPSRPPSSRSRSVHPINSGPRRFTAGELGERRWNDCARQRPTRAMASGSARWAPEGLSLLTGAERLLTRLTKQVSQSR